MQKKNQNNFNQLSSVDSTFSISEHTTEQFEKCFPLQIKHEKIIPWNSIIQMQY